MDGGPVQRWIRNDLPAKIQVVPAEQAAAASLACAPLEAG